MEKPQQVVALSDYQRNSGLNWGDFSKCLGISRGWYGVILKSWNIALITDTMKDTLASAGANKRHFEDATAPFFKDGVSPQQFRENLSTMLDTKKVMA